MSGALAGLGRCNLPLGLCKLAGATAAAVRMAAFALLAMALPAAPAGAQDAIEVDLELILAVDISLSMDVDEQRLQRDGHVAAIRHPQVVAAISDGLLGRIALTYVEWAGTGSERVVVPWSVIDGQETADAFADRLAAVPLRRAHRTSISAVLAFAGGLFEDNGLNGLRRVIDVSGDGANNEGVPVPGARDRLVERGIVINGLAIMIKRGDFGGRFDLEALDEYFEDCVIGGPGAFVIRITDKDQFATAIRRKMIQEIAQAEPRITPTAAQDLREPVDCLIGEKQWQRWQEMRDW
jgi:hypothetical protein